MRRGFLLLMLFAAACGDLAGPRPRPGAPEDQPTAQAPQILYWELQPRVVTQGVTDSVRIIVTLDVNPEFVYVEPRNGTIVSLTRVANNTYSGKLASAPLLFGYKTGDLRNVVGWIKASTGTQTAEQTLLVNVKDATVPTINPITIPGGMQAGAHVVNMRFDSLYLGGRLPANVMKAIYGQLTDAYTFATVVEQVTTAKSPFLTIVRNNIRGLGMIAFDNGATYGSAANLEAVLDIPNDVDFDPAQSSNLRELSHRWMNASTLSSMQTGKPNWPLSDIANGMVGWSDPVTGEPLNFPFNVVPQPNNTFTLELNDTTRSYNDLELYLMGLIPVDSVRPHLVFLNGNQRSRVRVNGVLQGPVDTITSARWTAKEGARSPAYGAAPRQFNMLTVVLSRGALLTKEELSFFEHVAARGERQEALPYFNGAARGTALPFYVATGRRGVLNTTLAPR